LRQSPDYTTDLYQSTKMEGNRHTLNAFQ